MIKRLRIEDIAFIVLAILIFFILLFSHNSNTETIRNRIDLSEPTVVTLP